ncbi:MAG TPA: TROVE domain-containing protein, partial [Thiolinea sp.]|nr:TROVE domain-containing protein [Thiolinea sp.]
MAKINQKAAPLTTHEGAVAMRLTPYQQLRRATCACLLWENSFYESGQTIAKRIKALVPQVEPALVSRLAIEL